MYMHGKKEYLLKYKEASKESKYMVAYMYKVSVRCPLG
jgi:hypothetical protein